MKNSVDQKDFENYLKEARSWETDKVIAAETSKKTAWIIATGSSFIAFVSVMAVAMLTPLKTTEPYVIRVDSSTGIVDIVKALKEGETNYEEAINKYFTQWYVRYREGYSKELAEEYYNNVGIMSSGTEQRRYLDYFSDRNPLSPLNIYGEYAKVKIRIKSTSFINPNIAMVRYSKEIERGTDKPQVTHWAATIAFKYSGAPMTEKDRGINPLGYQVTEYRNDPDSLNPESTQTTRYVPPTNQPKAITVFPGEPKTAPPSLTVPAIQTQ